jgi:predicted transposase YbfD/YdcC
LRSCIVRTLLRPAEFGRLDSPQFKHGRHQRRQYRYYSLEGLALYKRWHRPGLCTLIEVKRTRYDALGKSMSQSQSYYVSNAPMSCQSQANDLYDAIRGHWGVKVMHYRRDVILSEDAFRCLKKSVQQVMATVRTMAVCLLNGQNKSMNALIDLFRDKIKELFQFLNIKKVL